MVKLKIYHNISLNYRIITQMSVKVKDLGNLSTLFKKMGSNLENFYSSRPKDSTQRSCPCHTFKQTNSEEKEFYSKQSQMISHTCNILSDPNRPEEEHIFAQILMPSVSYIEKILELLERNILCECKQTALKQIPQLRQKTQFLREQNQKMFRLFEEKVAETEILKQKLKEMQAEYGNKFNFQTLKQSEKDDDLRPITARNEREISNLASSSTQMFPNSIKNNHQFSLTCSQISDCPGTQYLRQNIKPTPIMKKTTHFFRQRIQKRDEFKKSYFRWGQIRDFPKPPILIFTGHISKFLKQRDLVI